MRAHALLFDGKITEAKNISFYIRARFGGRLVRVKKIYRVSENYEIITLYMCIENAASALLTNPGDSRKTLRAFSPLSPIVRYITVQIKIARCFQSKIR